MVEKIFEGTDDNLKANERANSFIRKLKDIGNTPQTQYS